MSSTFRPYHLFLAQPFTFGVRRRAAWAHLAGVAGETSRRELPRQLGDNVPPPCLGGKLKRTR